MTHGTSDISPFVMFALKKPNLDKNICVIMAESSATVVEPSGEDRIRSPETRISFAKKVGIASSQSRLGVGARSVATTAA
jgi:hypothetical protein